MSMWRTDTEKECASNLGCWFYQKPGTHMELSAGRWLYRSWRNLECLRFWIQSNTSSNKKTPVNSNNNVQNWSPKSPIQIGAHFKALLSFLMGEFYFKKTLYMLQLLFLRKRCWVQSTETLQLCISYHW